LPSNQEEEVSMTLFVFLVVIANLVIAYNCYTHANKKGYPKQLFLALGCVPYFNLVVLVYILFLPNLRSESLFNNNAAN
jgi:hypothetical protein